MKRIAIVAVLLHCVCWFGCAQNSSSILDRYREKLGSMSSSYEKKVTESKSEFLKKAWAMREMAAGREDPFSRKDDAGIPEKADNDGTPAEGRRSVISSTDRKVTFGFYGKSLSVRFSPEQEFSLGSTDSDRLAQVWDMLNTELYRKTLDDCLAIRNDDRLCDWAYVCLVDSLARKVFPNNPDERQFLLGNLIGRSGYCTRFGIQNGRLHTLVGVSSTLYGRPYFSVDGMDFYPFDGAHGGMNLSDMCAGDSRPVSMLIPKPQQIGGSRNFVRHVKSSNGIEFDYALGTELTRFYFEYPHVEWTYKAKSAVSDYMRTGAYPAIRRKIDGLSQIDAANEILRFVGTSREYRTDDQNWGFEKWNFPDESCLYEYGDCDDYAILFCKLVEDLLGLETVLVSAEVDNGSHLTTAVRFTEPLEGDKLLYNGKTFYFCEPTSTFTKVGQRCWNKFEVKTISEF